MLFLSMEICAMRNLVFIYQSVILFKVIF
ncbi:hypothetical protein HORM4_790067 [Vibrio harveyi]|nr:hypothetical protein HORM4_790067 [Vibrio harveyi]